MLDISNSGLRSLKEVNIPEDITKLDCSDNELETLEGLEKCVNLTELYCYNNEIKILEGIYLSNLTKLNCISNKIKSLNCSGNVLETLEGLDKCVKLTELYCSRNELETLEGIEKCNKLTKLDCSNNKLRKLKYCPESIEFIVYDNNPIKIQLEQVGYRDRGRNIDEIHRINKEKWERSIYKEGMKEDNFL